MCIVRIDVLTLLLRLRKLCLSSLSTEEEGSTTELFILSIVFFVVVRSHRLVGVYSHCSLLVRCTKTMWWKKTKKEKVLFAVNDEVAGGSSSIMGMESFTSSSLFFFVLS